MSAPRRPPYATRRQVLRGSLLGSVASALPGGLLLSLGPTELAWGAQVLAVRLWPAQDYTRVTIESDTALTAKHFLMAHPDRLVIDVDGLELSPQLRELVRKVRADDPYIGGIRVGQHQPRVVRLVLDLKQVIQPQVFGLLPVAAYQHRMVFDLYPRSDTRAHAKLPAATASATAPASSPPTTPMVATATPPAQAVQPTGPSASSPGLAAPPLTGPVPGASPPSTHAPGPSQGPSPQGAPPTQATQATQAANAVNDALDDFITDMRRQSTDRALAGKGARNEAKADVRVDARADNRTEARSDTRAPARSDTAGKLIDSPRRDEEAELAALRKTTQRLVIVALDPGHGGEDPGAVGPSGLYEKHVALSVALKLRDRINAQPGMRAMLTRDADYFVPLYERVRKARRVQADLFVSIHADAFMNQQARGASVFALSERGATSAAARWMASRENASDQVGGVNIKASDAQVVKTLLDMSTTAQIKDSLKLGHAVLGHLGKVGRLHKAQVEQAGFAVLKAPDIPSILVETGFISNPEEEASLKDDNYQDQLAAALLLGITRYFAKNPPLARNRAL